MKNHSNHKHRFTHYEPINRLYDCAYAFASKPTPSTVNQPANATRTVTLALGQNIFVKEHQLNLTFDKVLNDSRCAITGVQCI